MKSYLTMALIPSSMGLICFSRTEPPYGSRIEKIYSEKSIESHPIDIGD
jgi:hypothetical protein